MTFPVFEPTTTWAHGEFSQTGLNFIVDPSGNFIVDPSGNFIVDTGIGVTNTPDTVWTPNDEVTGITVWQSQDGEGEFTQVSSLLFTDNSGNFIVTNSGNFIVTNPLQFTPPPSTVWTSSDGTE